MNFAFPEFTGADGSTFLRRLRATVEARLWPVVPGWVAFVAMLVVALMTGQFLWHFLQPEDIARSSPPSGEPRHLAALLQAHHLFGVDGRSSAKPIGNLGNLKLIGTVAGEGIALVAVDGRPARTFRVGAEIAPGLRVISVETRRIEIERLGVKESLLIPAARSPVG